MPSEKCKIRLGEPPACSDSHAMRAYAMCFAWSMVPPGPRTAGMAFGKAVVDGFHEAKKVCK